MKRLFVLLALWIVLAPVGSAQELDPWGMPKPWKRLEWFYSRRAFPNNDVPPGAWLRAYEQAQQLSVYQGEGLSGQALSWEFFGPDSTNQNWLARVNAIAIHPTDPNTIYIGVSKGGVWKSTNRGSTWTNLTDFLAAQYVGCLTIDPADPNTIYLGTGEEYYAGNTLGGVGIYKSTDGGSSWTLIGSSTFSGQRINEIVIDPNNRNKWIISTDAGIYVTTNGGSSFSRTLTGVASALRMHPTNPNILWAALGDIWGSSSNGVYVSTNGGSTWTRYNALPLGTSVGRVELDVCRSNPNVIYVVFGQTLFSGARIHSVWKTTSGGSGWTQLTNAPAGSGQSWYDLVMRVDPNDPNIAYVGEVELYRTTDGGNTWTKINGSGLSTAHVDQHALEFDPTDPSKIFIGCDGGLFYSANRGTNRTALNTGRGTMEFYAFDVHPTNANRLVAGSQDNGTQVRSTSNNYAITLGGDGFWAAYKRNDPNTVLGEVYYAIVYRSTNGGSSWSAVFNGSSDPRSPWSAPLVNDLNNSSTFYVGTIYVYGSTNSGVSWSRISGDLTRGSGTLSVIAIAPSNSNVIYTGSDDGAVYVSTDGGSTWTARYSGLPTRSVGGIAVHPSSPGTVYVGLQGFGSGHVYKSTNYGASWTNISGNLPDTPVNFLIVNPVAPTMLIAATDTGVFVTTDEGANWAKLGTGLPSTPCLHLRANATTGYLYVGTYGRGIWRMPLPSASFVTTRVLVDNVSGTLGGSVNLTATLQRTDTLAGISGKTLQFAVGGTPVGSAMTGSNGVATLAYTIPESFGTGTRTVSVTFEGDSTANPSSGTGNLSISRATPEIVLGNVTARRGQTVNLEAVLRRQDNASPISGRLITFKVAGTTVGSASTDSSGRASVPYTVPLNATLGSKVLRAEFAGDSVYLATSKDATLDVRKVLLQGRVALGDFGGTVSGLPVRVNVVQGSNSENLSATLDGSGRFSVETALAGTGSVAVKVTHWLRQRLNANLSGEVSLTWSLVNGDVDDDNEVTLFDFGQLVAAFGTMPGDSAWNPNADLDGDEEVTLFDFGILVRNFGMLGDD
ncbi:MAG: Ig-like domain repeat protein [Chthonomonadetes bacterium]|nr:Ig-like domain repeat protein [Chthonomonadetes bacterium]